MKRLKSWLRWLVIAAATISLVPAQTETPAQLGQKLAVSMQGQAQNANNALIALYNSQVATYTATYGTQPSAIAPAPPVPPALTLVNTVLVVQDEVLWATYAQAGNIAAAEAINWSLVYSTYQYQPPVPAPVVLPSICAPPGPPSNGCIDPVGPSSGSTSYLTVVGDTSANGTKFTDSRGTFVKTVTMTPFGSSAYWSVAH